MPTASRWRSTARSRRSASRRSARGRTTSARRRRPGSRWSARATTRSPRRWPPPTRRSTRPRRTGATRSSAPRGVRWSRCVAQALDLRGAEPPHVALAQVAEAQRAERDPLQVGDRMADGRTHPLDLALAALAQRELQDAGPQLAHAGRRGHAVVELYAFAQLLQRALRDGAALDVGDVGLGDLVARVREAVGEVAVVGEQDQAGGVGVQAPDGIEPGLG